MNVDEFLSGAREAPHVRRVYGDPVERGGVTVVPAAIVFGGGGGGGDNENNGGGGFGVVARPAGAWVIRDGQVSWQPAFSLSLMLGIGLTGFLVGRVLGR